ncbi:MAG: Ig-like domain-containing protein [Oscillospiraceae bacterium]|jgi:rubrerythrin|nr:Ig-like domain-containing protein [Oscillospiraceae bacterium]
MADEPKDKNAEYEFDTAHIAGKEGRLTRILADSDNEKARKMVYNGFFAALVVIFIGGFFWGVNKLLAAEPAEPPTVVEPSYEPSPQYPAAPGLTASTPEEVLAYLADKVAEAQTAGAKLERENRFDPDAGAAELTSGLAEELRPILQFAKDDNNSMQDKQEKLTVNYGDTLEALLYALPASLPEGTELLCSDRYYKCSECGREETGYAPAVCPNEECGAADAYELQEQYRGDVYIRIAQTGTNTILGGQTGSFETLAAADPVAAADALTEGTVQGMLSAAIPEGEVRGAVIQAWVNRLTGQLTGIDIENQLVADLTATESGLAGGFAAEVGRIPLNDISKLRFTFPGIKMDARTKTIGLKDTVEVRQHPDGPLGVDTPITWTTSDESIATMDKEGFVHSHGKAGTAVVTASMEFNGKTLSADCVITVQTSVEGVKISKRKLALAPGETYTQKVTFDPTDATNQKVHWSTDNADVATVSADGVITAVGPGEAVVKCLTDDGYYRASCTVTVKGAE